MPLFIVTGSLLCSEPGQLLFHDGNNTQTTLFDQWRSGKERTGLDFIEGAGYGKGWRRNANGPL
jgi:hypothetical protein